MSAGKERSRKQLLQQLQTETDTAYLYGRFAGMAGDEQVAGVFRRMEKIEEGHARRIMDQLVVPAPAPSWRARFQAFVARMMGYEFVLPNLLAQERSMSNAVLLGKKQRGEPVSGGEQNHIAILQGLGGGAIGGEHLARLEGKHKAVGGNALRAAVLGANDGLVSNLSLVTGVAGATSGNQEILIAGFAGLLAGAFSMALGEWLSVQSSRELFQRQIDIEMEELENSPEEEMAELALIYQAKGVSPDEALALARQVLSNKETAYLTLAREELGIDPKELGGSAWEAAITSFFLFAIGAIIPVIPFLLMQGRPALLLSLGISTLGLFGIGAAITVFTGRSLWFSGMRQVLFGLAAAAITYGIGSLIGVSIAG